MKKVLIVLGIIGVLIFGYNVAQAQDWKPNPKFVKDTAHHKTVGSQCYGTTKKGLRCKQHGQPTNGRYYCRFHVNQK